MLLYCAKCKCCCSAETRAKTVKLEKMFGVASHRLESSLNVITVVKWMRDLRVINSETLGNKKTKFLIDHSNINCIALDTDADEKEEHFFGNCEEPEELEEFIKQEDNKNIFRHKFRFDLGEPERGVELPQGFLGAKEEKPPDDDIHYFA